MRRVLVSVITACILGLSGGALAKSPRDVLRALNKTKFKGNAFLLSAPNYRFLSRHKYHERIATLIEGVPLHKGRDRVSAGHGNAKFENEGLYGLHQLLVGRKGSRILLAVVDGLWGDSYLGGFAAEKVVAELQYALARQSLRDSLLGLPEQLEIVVDRQVRGHKESDYPGDYGSTMPIAEDAGAFVIAAEISNDKLQVEHIGNARLLLIRKGTVLWHTEDHNREYRMSSNPEVVINPADEAEGNVFRAIELPANMGAPIAELLESNSVELCRGDRIVLASDSVWAACTNTDLLDWTSGRGNAEASRYASDKIAQRIAQLNAQDEGEAYDEKFTLIIYDYMVE